MHNLDPHYDPGGHTFGQRLRGLSRSLQELAQRLREGVARVVSQAVTDVVHDTVRELWGRLVAAPTPLRRDPTPPSWDDPPNDMGDWDRFREEQDQQEERLFRPSQGRDRFPSEDWEEESDSDPDLEVPHATEIPSSPRWSEALAAGLQAMAWCMRRRPGPLSVLTALGVGLTSTLGTYVVGPVAVTGVALAGSALTLLKLSQLAEKFNVSARITS